MIKQKKKKKNTEKAAKSTKNQQVFAEITGLRVEKNLESLCKEGVVFKQIRKKDGKFLVVFSMEYLQKVQAFFRERKINFEVTSTQGFWQFFQKATARTGMVAGLFLGIFCLFFGQLFVFRFDIQGLETITQNQVFEALKSENISPFRMVYDVNRMEEILVEKIENISMASVVRKGSTLVISIKEKSGQGEILTLKPLVSAADGMVKEIHLIQGTLNVRVGQIIKQGETLVFPYAFDSKGNQFPITPMANGTLEIFSSATVQHYENSLEDVRTGKTERKRVLISFGQLLFSAAVNFPGCSFQRYEMEYQKVQVFENNLIPMTYYDIIFYETKLQPKFAPYETVRPQLLEKARQEALAKLPAHAAVSDTIINESSAFGMFNLEVVLVAELKF